MKCYVVYVEKVIEGIK